MKGVLLRVPPAAALMVQSTPPRVVLWSATALSSGADERIRSGFSRFKSHALATAAVQRLTRVFRLNRCVWETSGLDPRTGVNGAPVPCCSRTDTTTTAPKIRWNTENCWFSGECFAFTTDPRLPSVYTRAWVECMK